MSFCKPSVVFHLQLQTFLNKHNFTIYTTTVHSNTILYPNKLKDLCSCEFEAFH